MLQIWASGLLVATSATVGLTGNKMFYLHSTNQMVHLNGYGLLFGLITVYIMNNIFYFLLLGISTITPICLATCHFFRVQSGVSPRNSFSLLKSTDGHHTCCRIRRLKRQNNSKELHLQWKRQTITTWHITANCRTFHTWDNVEC